MTVERLRALAAEWRAQADTHADIAKRCQDLGTVQQHGAKGLAQALRFAASELEDLADEIEAESRVGQVPDAPGLYRFSGVAHVERDEDRQWLYVRVDDLLGIIIREDGKPKPWALAQTWGGRVAEPPKPEGA